MKKVIMSTFAGLLCFSGVSADTAVVTAHEEPTMVVEEEHPETAIVEEEASSLGGVNLILGIGGNFPEIKSETRYNVDSGSNFKAGDETAPKCKSTDKRFFGTVGLAGGKVFGNGVYAGVECLYDFTKSKTREQIKVSGSTINAGARLGYTFGPARSCMVYGKVAAQWSEAKLYGRDKQTNVKNDKPVLALGLGVEKAISSKFSGRLEGDYSFSSKKSGKISNIDDNVNKRSDDCTGKLKKDHNFNIRALISYNMHM